MHRGPRPLPQLDHHRRARLAGDRGGERGLPSSSPSTRTLAPLGRLSTDTPNPWNQRTRSPEASCTASFPAMTVEPSQPFLASASRRSALRASESCSSVGAFSRGGGGGGSAGRRERSSRGWPAPTAPAAPGAARRGRQSGARRPGGPETTWPRQPSRPARPYRSRPWDECEGRLLHRRERRLVVRLLPISGTSWRVDHLVVLVEHDHRAGGDAGERAVQMATP